MITIVGLGPAGVDSMSIFAQEVLQSADRIYFRTRKHPAAEELAARGLRFETFDEVYEAAADFFEVYNTIASRIIEDARGGEVTYAVPGHPLVAERSVEIIIDMARDEAIPFRFAASKSFIEACLEALAVHLDKGLKLIDALAIAETRPSTDCPNLIYQVYDRTIASDVKLALMEDYPDEFEVHVISSAGSPNESVEKLPLYMLDRRDFDHLTSVYVSGR